MANKIAIVTTHPIQYYAPLFKLLAKQIDLKVFYTWGKSSLDKFDPGFGKKIEWDIPLLDGYEYQFLENTAKEPGSHTFKGIKNPTIVNDIVAYKPDAILVFGWSYASHLKVLRYFKGKIPVYFRGDSTLLDNDNSSTKGKMKLFLKQQFLKWVYSNVDTAFYVGKANKAYFKWVGLKENQLVFAPHAIDNSRFEEDFTEKAIELRNELLIPEQSIVILFAGKLESKKNPFILLNAFIASNSENLHLVFVGNGNEEEKLKMQAEQSVKKDFIHFVDFQNQSVMPIWYQMADIFCLPSKGPGETWGLAVNEAMACAKAIIVSDKVGCSRDLIKDGTNGWIFENDNREELQCILESISSKGRLLEMGIQSKKIVKDWDITKTSEYLISDWNRRII